MAKKRSKSRVTKRHPKRPVQRASNERKSRYAKGLKKFPDHQGIAEKQPKTGYKRPPVEHQFKPGQSGNPAGCPKGQTFFRWWVCKFLSMTDGELAAAAKDKGLTQVQRAALKAVRQIAKKGLAGSVWLALRELMHYDEGKPTEHVQIHEDDAMSDDEVEDIRREMAKRFGKGGEA